MHAEAALHPELRQRQRLAPAGGVAQRVLDIREAVLAHLNDGPAIALLEGELDSRRGLRLLDAPLKDEPLGAPRLEDSPRELRVDLVRAPLDELEDHRAAGTRIDAPTLGEPRVETVGCRERVIDLLARRADELLVCRFHVQLRWNVSPPRRGASGARVLSPSVR